MQQMSRKQIAGNHFKFNYIDYKSTKFLIKNNKEYSYMEREVLKKIDNEDVEKYTNLF